MTSALTRDDLLTEAEAADILRLKPDTLRHWRRRKGRKKKGPPYSQPHPHGRVLYQRSDLLAWLNANRIETK